MLGLGARGGCFCSRRKAFLGGKRIESSAASKIPTKRQQLWADLCAIAWGEMGCAGLAAPCKAEQPPANSQAVANALVRCEARTMRAEPGSRDSARAAVKHEVLRGRGFAASVTQPPRASSTPQVLLRPGGCKGRTPCGSAGARCCPGVWDLL